MPVVSPKALNTAVKSFHGVGSGSQPLTFALGEGADSWSLGYDFNKENLYVRRLIVVYPGEGGIPCEADLNLVNKKTAASLASTKGKQDSVTMAFSGDLVPYSVVVPEGGYAVSKEESASLVKATRVAIPAILIDDPRPHLNGAYVRKAAQGVIVMATDGVLATDQVATLSHDALKQDDTIQLNWVGLRDGAFLPTEIVQFLANKQSKVIERASIGVSDGFLAGTIPVPGKAPLAWFASYTSRVSSYSGDYCDATQMPDMDVLNKYKNKPHVATLSMSALSAFVDRVKNPSVRTVSASKLMPKETPIRFINDGGNLVALHYDNNARRTDAVVGRVENPVAMRPFRLALMCVDAILNAVGEADVDEVVVKDAEAYGTNVVIFCASGTSILACTLRPTTTDE